MVVRGRHGDEQVYLMSSDRGSTTPERSWVVGIWLVSEPTSCCERWAYLLSVFGEEGHQMDDSWRDGVRHPLIVGLVWLDLRSVRNERDGMARAQLVAWGHA